MPNELRLEINADVDGAIAGLKAVQGGIVKLNKTTLDFVSTLKGSFDPAVFKSFTGGTASINQMKLALETLKENLRHTTDPKQLVQYNLAIKDIEGNLKRAASAGTQFGGQAGKAFSSITQSAFSLARILPGIGIAGIIGIASDALINLASSFIKAKEAVVVNLDVIKESDKDYKKAVANVDELRINIDLARQGFLNKNDVVKQYNETIGKTTGQVKNLDEAEQALNKNAEAYIKFTLLKAAANIALDKAAQKAFETEVTRREEAQKFLNVGDKLVGLSERSSGAAPGGFVPSGDALKREKSVLDAQANIRKADAIKRGEDAQKTFEKIAADLQKQSADIAKKFHFSFFAGFDDKKDKNIQDDIIAKAKAFIKEFGNVFVVPDLEISFTNTKEKVFAAAKKLLSDIDKGLLQLKLLDRPREIQVPIEIDFKVANDLQKARDDLFKNANILGDKTKIISGIVPGASEDVAKRNKQFFDDFQKQIQATADLVSGALSPAFTDMFDAIVAGENPLKAFFNGLQQGLNQLIKKLIQAAIEAAILSAISGGATSFGGAFSKILGLGGTANRGFGLGGAIAGRSFQNTLNVVVQGQISGQTILLAGQRAAGSNTR